MNEIKWVDSHIEIEPPKRTKKITGTRFATILGLNPWSTEFEMWCAITKTYEKPFEDTIYTIAGKTIEPKQAEYIENSYGLDLISPTDKYGSDYFSKTFGDFFGDNHVLGGMWDYLGTDENGKVDTVYEMKTTKRIEDWKDDVPEYYALQASLYAYLLGVDNVVMVASFLEENNYNNPEAYHPTVNNTITKEFKVSERYPDFEEKVKKVIKWWDSHVVTGISPDYNEQKDVEILKNLRTSSLSPDTDIKSLMVEGESLKEEIDTVTNSIADKTKRLKKINELIKEYAISQFKDGDKKAEIQGSKYTWTVTKTVTNTVNKDALEANGVLDKYMTQNETFKITVR